MTETKTPEKKRIRHLTTAQKAEAIALWKAGNVTLDDLAKQFKKDRGTFIRLFKDAGAEKGALKAETERKVTEAVEALAVDNATIKAKQIKEMQDSHLRYADGVSKLAWNLIVKARQANLEPAAYANDMKSLEMAMRVFRMTREELYVIHGIRETDANEDKPLPDLVVQELTAQDITELHERSLMSDDELGLNESLGDEELIDDGDLVDEDDERVETDE